MARGLKSGAPLAFTYHHNKLEAYYAVGVAILDAELICSASLPCPAEMGGSIHIHGTASSIVDTVFVCRNHGQAPRQWLFSTSEGLASIVADDVAQLIEGGREPTKGDVRCVIFGHLTRMAVWNLRKRWDRTDRTNAKLQRFAKAVADLADPEAILDRLMSSRMVIASAGPLFAAARPTETSHDAVTF
jgi:hypothetical protein